jgi:hypothetical protein
LGEGSGDAKGPQKLRLERGKILDSSRIFFLVQ